METRGSQGGRQGWWYDSSSGRTYQQDGNGSVRFAGPNGSSGTIPANGASNGGVYAAIKEHERRERR